MEKYISDPIPFDLDCVSSQTNELKCTTDIVQIMKTQSRCLRLQQMCRTLEELETLVLYFEKMNKKGGGVGVLMSI